MSLALSAPQLVRGLRRLAPLVPRLAGLVLLASGGYVAYYGWYETSFLRGGDPADPLVTRAVAVQTWLAEGVHQDGVPLLAGLLAALVLAVVPTRLIARRACRRPADRGTGQ